MFHIFTSEYDGEVSVVNPAAFPIYFGLHSCEPWIAKDGFMLAEVGEKELKRDCGRTGSYIQNGVVMKVSASVLSPIDVKQFAGIWELFDGKSEPFGVGEVHKIFGGSQIKERKCFGPFCDRMNKESNSHRFSCRHIYIRVAVSSDQGRPNQTEGKSSCGPISFANLSLLSWGIPINS